MGPTGAGHYVKMVHNGIEYGMMQAYAEGFDLFDKSEYELDNAKIAHLWMQGSVVRSWLCELAAIAFEQEGNDLADLTPFTADSARAAGRWRTRWTRTCPPPCITASLHARFYSPRQRRLHPPDARRAARPVRRPRGEDARDGARADVATPREPAREGSSACPVHPTTLVIFGATGDLSRRKLLPRVYNLAHEGALPERFTSSAFSARR
jgi:hypothetical protein